MTGGDVLERADLYQLLDYARRRGVKPTVSLSVTPALTGAVVGKLRHNGAHRLALSIDSAVPESHDAFRKVSGQFAATLLALRWARTAEIPLEVNTLVAHRNLGELHRIAELVGDIGIDRWNLFFLVPTGPAKNIEMLNADEVEQAFEVIHELSQQTGFRIRTFEAPQFRAADDFSPTETLGRVAWSGDTLWGSNSLRRVSQRVSSFELLCPTKLTSQPPRDQRLAQCRPQWR